MKYILSKLLIVLLVNTAHAQITWHEIQTPTEKDLNTIQFISDQIGFVGGDSVLLKTIDGGVTWTELEIDSIPSWQTPGANIFDMHWFTENRGIVMAGIWGGGFETMDGGLNWEVMNFGNGGFCQTTSLFFFDENNGFAGGAGCFEGHIIDRLSGGNWSTTNDPQDWNSDNWVSTIEFQDAMNGFAGTLRGTLLRTTDGGMNWDTLSTPAGDTTITDFIFYPNGDIRATHENGGQWGVMISQDGGLSWEIDMETATFFYPYMSAAHIDANGTTYLGGREGNSGLQGVIFENSGGFWNWGSVNQPISDIASYGDSITFAVGDSGVIYSNVNPSALGIEDTPEIEFGIAPNPTSVWIEIQGLAEAVESYSIVDALGKVIIDLKSPSLSSERIDVSELKSGIYSLTIQTQKGAGTRRFVKI